jgi:hypothetical protein
VGKSRPFPYSRLWMNRQPENSPMLKSAIHGHATGDEPCLKGLQKKPLK